MKKITSMLLSCSVLVVACAQPNSTDNGKAKIKKEQPEQTRTIFRPDSSINGEIYLHNPSSTANNLGDIMSLVDTNSTLPSAFFKNGTGEEYIQLFVFPGSEANSISYFTVGHSADLSGVEKLNPSRLAAFHTESGIKLGMTRRELISIKGVDYTEEEIGDFQQLSYKINIDTSTFLSRYNMPLYVADYWFRDDSLIKYQFGFEYP